MDVDSENRRRHRRYCGLHDNTSADNHLKKTTPSHSAISRKNTYLHFYSDCFPKYTPKNVPQAIQTRLNTALKAALNDPDVKKRLADSNIDVVSMDKVSANGLKTHLDSEVNKWGPVIRKANIPD